MAQQLAGENVAAGSPSALEIPGMNPVQTEGPGGRKVNVTGIIGLSAYLVVLGVLMIYSLVILWPDPPSGQPKPGAVSNPAANSSGTDNQPSADATGQPPTSPRKRVKFLGTDYWIADEQRLLFLVILTGALGSLVHAIRSVYWYVGNRTLVRSWALMYLLLPFAGTALALVFYLVVRGGFFSPQSSFEQTSPFGFAAFAALIGMFSPQAVLKLREVAETLLSKPQPGANANPQEAVHAVPTPSPGPQLGPPPSQLPE